MAYLHRTPQTGDVVLGIFEERVAQLLEDQALMDSLSGGIGSDPSTGLDLDQNLYLSLDTAAHLARAQALAIYQTIRLFDGDIRMAAQAEMHIRRCSCGSSRQMWDSTISSFSCRDNTLNTTSMDLWSGWIFVERVRRIWIVTTTVQQIYLTLKHGWYRCTGATKFNMREELWDAESAQQ
ncbi:uncharacterized protein BCR38DRAFT_483956 [Pseudomassariella vexata]|uniref:Uncharacterized protein n=1 Tax=Pseudomassariella vexata TaxID=1141098 RepID=A0A1Y2E476_9PEZI|nr:uncharacterized protein BCR38DRAFT_483956 [Pseudomassariella vexata]ORY66319.1 hypothetical protein BCR38DRAFT_483956 [Pseudomassariella vexata]